MKASEVGKEKRRTAAEIAILAALRESKEDVRPNSLFESVRRMGVKNENDFKIAIWQLLDDQCIRLTPGRAFHLIENHRR